MRFLFDMCMNSLSAIKSPWNNDFLVIFIKLGVVSLAQNMQPFDNEVEEYWIRYE